MRIVIADDEKLAREELRYLLEQTGNTDIAGEALNGIEAVELCRNLKPDVIFLDIQMPGKNGIEAAEEIIELDPSPAIIFQTAYDEFAIKAFELSAADYLLKPVSKKRLEAALARLEKRRVPAEEIRVLLDSLTPDKKKDHKTIAVHSGDSIIPLKQEEIIFIEARGKTVRIISRRGEFSYSGAFWEIEERMTHPDFFKCHRSYLVNTSLIERIELWVNSTYMLSFKETKERVPVSRGRMSDFRKRFDL